VSLFAVVALAACGWWMSGRPGNGGGDRLTFAHQIHVEDFGMLCDECHAGVADATDLSQSLLPQEDVCLDCHDREDECTSCHSNPDMLTPGMAVTAAPDLGFSHADHLERVDNECETCHVGAADATQLPLEPITMDTCLECHNHQAQYDRAECTPCHTTFREVPLRAVAEFEHGAGWMGQHGMLARSEGMACYQCHTESQCAECHSQVAPAMSVRLYPDQVDRTLLHRGDWLSTHAIEARADADMCGRCHEPSTFCQDCHTEQGRTPLVADPRSPHPPGWVGPGGDNFHGREARLQINSCASCHDQGPASNCVQCHAVGRVGGNPHPEGWDDRHELEDAAGDPMCRVCHN
jgi:hypothetical protein